MNNGSVQLPAGGVTVVRTSHSTSTKLILI